MANLSGHQRCTTPETEEWLTPPDILQRLGAFDLVPCAAWSRTEPPVQYSKEDDGLSKPWFGRVWCNPPFGRDAIKWLRKMAAHNNGIALIPARTETRMFYECVWGASDAVLFIAGRPHFYTRKLERAPFNSGAPICLVAYGEDNADVLFQSGLGFVVPSGTSYNAGAK